MASPTPEEWRVLSLLLDEVLDLPSTEHAAWLAQLRERDADSARQLAAMLEARDNASREGFLHGTATPPPVVGGRPGAVCGAYRLESLIGRGGMGSVWLAKREDGHYDADVAVKLLSMSMVSNVGQRRFKREGQILAKLRHPHIAQLLDAGVSSEGQPYLVLEHVDGTHLDEWCRDQQLDVRARVRLMLDVMSAVAHAHASLVVHRDLKPSNILVDRDGRVKLLDFGIAKMLEEEDGPAVTALTNDGGALLTPRYASPEQVKGQEITIATDVYSLGVILFEVLSGTRPYTLERDSAGALEEAILSGDPGRPSERATDVVARRALQGDLDTIVQKTLRKEVPQRYSTVPALMDDLTAWLDGKPVRARPDSIGYRARRFVQRHALAVAMATVVLLSVIGGAGAAIWQAGVARAEQQRAEEVTALITGIFKNADPYIGDGSPLSATQLLQQAWARMDTTLMTRPDLRFELTWLIGSSRTSLQSFTAATPILLAADSMADQLFAPTDERRLRTKVSLSGLYRARGQLDAMDTVLTNTLQLLRRTPNVDRSLLVAALVDSSHLAIDRGQAEAAVPPVREADSLARHDLPLGHELRINAVQVLAVAIENLGKDPNEALALARRAVDETREHYGGIASHPRVIEGQMMLGRALGRTGRILEAISVLTEADSASLVSMGPDNYTRAFIQASRASDYLDLAQLDNALAGFDQARRILRANDDSTSVSYGIVQSNRGTTLVRLGRGADAVVSLTNAIALLTTALGAEHPRVAANRIRLVQAEALAGRMAAARTQLAAVAKDTASLPPSSMVQFHYTLGMLHRLDGRATDAVNTLQHALALTADSTSASGQRVRAPLLTELAAAHRAANQPSRARVVAEDARRAYSDAGITALPPLVRQALGAKKIPRM